MANLSTSRNYKTWYGCSMTMALWIPLEHLEQMQQFIAGMTKLCQHVILEQAGNSRNTIRSCPLYAAIFTKLSSLYIKLAAMPIATPNKHPRSGLTKSKDTKSQRKKNGQRKKVG
eukprot:15271975-Ditylum_brightwellii.AAC.2